MLDDSAYLCASVTDPFVLHEDRPVPLGGLLNPVGVGYLLIGRNPVMLGQRH
jgi:hypothetical protein